MGESEYLTATPFFQETECAPGDRDGLHWPHICSWGPSWWRPRGWPLLAGGLSLPGNLISSKKEKIPESLAFAFPFLHPTERHKPRKPTQSDTPREPPQTLTVALWQLPLSAFRVDRFQLTGVLAFADTAAFIN